MLLLCSGPFRCLLSLLLLLLMSPQLLLVAVASCPPRCTWNPCRCKGRGMAPCEAAARRGLSLVPAMLEPLMTESLNWTLVTACCLPLQLLPLSALPRLQRLAFPESTTAAANDAATDGGFQPPHPDSPQSALSDLIHSSTPIGACNCC